MYAFSAVAVTRSYSPHLGAMSVEQQTNRFGAIFPIISFTRCSCRGYLNDHRKHTPIASTPASTRRPIADSASDSFRGTTTSPKQSTRSDTPSIRRFGTIGTGFWLEGKWTTLAMSREETPREPRMMWIASSWPCVVIRPTRAPFLWMSAFVPTVVPWVSTAISPQNCSNESPRRSAATRIAAIMPSAKSAGVEGALVAVMRPERSSATQSVNVPPMSTPTRSRATLSFPARGEGGMVAYFCESPGAGVNWPIYPLFAISGDTYGERRGGDRSEGPDAES